MAQSTPLRPLHGAQRADADFLSRHYREIGISAVVAAKAIRVGTPAVHVARDMPFASAYELAEKN